MNKNIILTFILSLLLSCSSDEFSKIVNYNTVSVREPLICKTLIGEEIIFDDSIASSFSSIIVYDSLLLAYQYSAKGGYFYHVYNLNNKKNVGQFFPIGNAGNENIGLVPMAQCMMKNG